MERMLTTPRERSAASYLVQIVNYVVERRNATSFSTDEHIELRELCESFTHEVVEAAAEKGRGQIQS